jgi:hypothetical protein
LNKAPFSSKLLTIAPSCLSSKSMPMYKASMGEARCGAVFPGNSTPVLMLHLKTCSLSPYLPTGTKASQNNIGREFLAPYIVDSEGLRLSDIGGAACAFALTGRLTLS